MSQDGAGVVTTYYAGPHYEVRVAAGQDQASLRYRLGDRLVALRLADGRRQCHLAGYTAQRVRGVGSQALAPDRAPLGREA